MAKMTRAQRAQKICNELNGVRNFMTERARRFVDSCELMTIESEFGKAYDNGEDLEEVADDLADEWGYVNGFPEICTYMDDEIRESMHPEYVGATDKEFLQEYVRRDPDPDFREILENEFHVYIDD